MEVANKNLMVLPKLCIECDDCFRVECQLCSPCFTTETKSILSQSYLEHQNKMDFQRIFPPPIVSLYSIYVFCMNTNLLFSDKRYGTEGLYTKKSITSEVVSRQM